MPPARVDVRTWVIITSQYFHDTMGFDKRKNGSIACLLTSLMLDAEKVHFCEIYSGKDEDWLLKSVQVDKKFTFVNLNQQ